MMSAEQENIVRSPFPRLVEPKMNIFSFISEHWCRYGTKEALIDSATGRTYRYSELHGAVSAVAEMLLSTGFQRGDKLAFFAYNSVEMPLAMFAVWKLGGIVTSLNPHLSAGECEKLMQIVEPEFLFCDQKHKDVLRKSTLDFKATFTQDEVASAAKTDQHLERGTVDVDVNSPSTILFSSGTTGRPKACVLSHRSMIARCFFRSEGTVRGLCPGASGSQVIFQPLSHIYGIVLVAFCLRNGDPVVTMPAFHLKKYLALIEKYKAPCMNLVPPLAVLLVKNKAIVQKFDLSHVRVVGCAAAVLHPDVASSLLELFPTAQKTVTQTYGLSETAGGFCTTPSNEFMEKHGHPDSPNSVGLVTFNSMVQVRDVNTGLSLPFNKVGEICCKSSLNFIGYYNNQEATDTIYDSDGWIRTGDLGFYDSKGYFYIVDRLKDIIKCNSYQVSPSELEDLLLSHPDIADAGVVGIEDASYGEVPSALVVLHHQSKMSADDIRNFVADNVASYKKLRGPVQIVEKIPKTTSGKILRRQIIEMLRPISQSKL